MHTFLQEIPKGMPKRIRYIICMIIVSGCSYTFAYQETIDFNTYLGYINAFNKYDTNISDTELETAYQAVKNNTCTRTEDGDDYIIDALCMWQETLPEMPFTDAIDRIWDDIEGFNYVYNTTPTEIFDYEGGLPNYKDTSLVDFLLVQNTRAHKAVATYHALQDNKIRISKNMVAQLQAQKYRFYAVYNDTSMRKGCTLTNYEVALYSMDKIFLYPGDVFNFNTHISDLDYCKGSGRTDLQFYGGVCGAASQLFRTSLLIPFVTVTQRQGHSERWAKYYGDDITGDDAAIYEMYKQLEIQNTGSRGLYFRTIKGDKYTYLVAIAPYQPDEAVRISRYRESKFKTNVVKSVYNIQTRIFDDQASEFPTQYQKRNYNTN